MPSPAFAERRRNTAHPDHRDCPAYRARKVIGAILACPVRPVSMGAKVNRARAVQRVRLAIRAIRGWMDGTVYRVSRAWTVCRDGPVRMASRAKMARMEFPVSMGATVSTARMVSAGTRTDASCWSSVQLIVDYYLPIRRISRPDRTGGTARTAWTER